MRVLLSGLAFLALVPAGLAQISPAEQFQALKKEVQEKQKALLKEYAAAKGEEKDKIVERYFAVAGEYAGRFLKLAQDNIKDPVAVEALLFVSSSFAQGDKAEAAIGKALGILASLDVDAKKLSLACARQQRSASPAIGEALRILYTKHADPEVKMAAGLSLGLNLRLQYEAAYQKGKKNAPQLKEAEQILTAVADKAEGARGQLAQDSLFELKTFTVGMTAPDIDGEDIDGKKFKLSDYRGKVVVLDFWGHW